MLRLSKLKLSRLTSLIVTSCDVTADLGKDSIKLLNFMNTRLQRQIKEQRKIWSKNNIEKTVKWCRRYWLTNSLIYKNIKKTEQWITKMILNAKTLKKYIKIQYAINFHIKKQTYDKLTQCHNEMFINYFKALHSWSRFTAMSISLFSCWLLTSYDSNNPDYKC